MDEAIELAKKAKKPAMDEDSYNTIGRLQTEVGELKATIKQQREEISKAADATSNSNTQLERANKELETHKQQLQQFRNTVEKLKSEVEHEKAIAEENERFLNKAYADLSDANNTRRNLIKAKDDIEAEKKEKELESDDLRQQWAEAQARIEQLEEEQAAIEQLDTQNQGLEADIERLTGTIADHERTLIVKDERIAHLESQYQKERQRNLHAATATAAAADAAAIAATTSPTSEAPPSLPSSSTHTAHDSLATELSQLEDDEYDEIHYEPNELSDITAVADFAPIELASRPDNTIHVEQAVSVAPVERQVKTASASVQTDAPTFSQLTPTATVDISPIAPVEPAPPALSSNVVGHAAIAVSPIEPAPPALTSSVVEEAAIEVSPIEPVAPRLTSHLVDTASIAVSPTEVAVPRLSSHVVDTAFIAVSPVEPEQENIRASDANISLGPIVVTLEEEPVEARFSQRPTTSTGAQTTEIPAEANATPAAPVVFASEPKKPGLLGLLQRWAHTIIISLLALICLLLWLELELWQTANGVGYAPDDAGSYTGAFGNGRYLFGFIPLAMDIGDSWWEEQLARYSSMAVTVFEEWAGISHDPFY